MGQFWCNDHLKYTIALMDYYSSLESSRNIWQFDVRDAFEPNILSCAVENDYLTKTESTYVKISAVVTYHTCYIKENGKQDLLLISLGNSVAVKILLIMLTFIS